MDTTTLPPVTPAPATSAPIQGGGARPLIGEFIRHPAWLWLTHVAPIGLLLGWAGHTYWLVQSEMDAAERGESLGLALALGLILFGTGALALRLQRAGRLLSEGHCAGLLLASLAVLGVGLRFCWFTIPWSVPEWLANQTELLFESFCLGMPGAFYAILVLAAQPLRRHGGKEFAFLVGGTVLGALAFYGVIYAFAELERLRAFPEWMGLGLALTGVFVGGTAITALITRSTLIAYAGVRRTRPAFQRCFMFLVAVCGPIGGLYLNKTIPFPVDLQAPVIYLLALVNGGLLMLPVVRSIFWHRVIWLAQCLLFPFSAYFFILFLPFLPLSLFAMIAFGSGFLVLVPLVLGLTHACRLADGFREEVRDGRRWPIAVLGLGAVLTLPALGLSDAWQDRVSLDEALTYIYAPDYRKDVTYPGSLPRLSSALQHLRDAKHGIFLPFLTPLYGEIVFHGLVLPDAKINDLQTAFFGDTATREASVLLRSPGDNGWAPGPPEQPDHNVVLDDVKVTGQADGTTHTAQLLLTMRNCGAAQGEFTTTVHIPEGVYVTGFSLKIGDDFVPARIVEKKTALWVYEKITRISHRDPGILIFTSRTDLNLRVAPFAVGQVRQARLDLVYADGTCAPLTIGDRTVALDDGAKGAAPVAVTTSVTDAGSLAIANVADAAAWQIRRTPYLDILIDCSRGATYSATSLADAIVQARKAFPEATLARVTAVNFEARDLVSNLVPVGQLDAAGLCTKLLPSHGGLLQDRFLKRGLLLAGDLMQTGEEQAKLRPQFILISSRGVAGEREDRLADFLRFAPDARVIYAEDSSGLFHGQDVVSRQPVGLEAAPPVSLWRWDNHYAVGAAGPRLAVNFPGGLRSSAPQIYDPQQRQFVAAPSVVAVPSSSRFADGVRTLAAQDEAEFDPHVLKDGASALIGLSKQTGILIPDSSYIAVESMSQWRLLEDKEKQKLANKQVFEIEEPVATPEPGTWTLLGLGLVLLIFARWRFSLAGGAPADCPRMKAPTWGMTSSVARDK
jgi:hypothetical protein